MTESIRLFLPRSGSISYSSRALQSDNFTSDNFKVLQGRRPLPFQPHQVDKEKDENAPTNL